MVNSLSSAMSSFRCDAIRFESVSETRRCHQFRMRLSSSVGDFSTETGDRRFDEIRAELFYSFNCHCVVIGGVIMADDRATKSLSGSSIELETANFIE